MNDINKDFKASSQKRKSIREILADMTLMLCAVYTVYSIFYPAGMHWQYAKKEKIEKRIFEIASLNLESQDQGMSTILICQLLHYPF